MPNGKKIKSGIHIPNQGANTPSIVKLLNASVKIKYAKKKKTATTTGNPNPPFLMIAPRGAPTKNKTIQAKQIFIF